jgi:hypothetical protein
MLEVNNFWDTCTVTVHSPTIEELLVDGGTRLRGTHAEENHPGYLLARLGRRAARGVELP